MRYIDTAIGYRGQSSHRTVELKGVKEALRALDPKHVERATRLSINKCARSARTEASKAIRAKFNLPAARVNKEVRNISMARTGHLEAMIRAAGRPISLAAFGAKWVRNAYGRSRTTTRKRSTIGKRRSRRTGVFVKVDKASGRRHYPDAFMGRGKRGGGGFGYGEGALLVFQRTKNDRLVHKAAITIASMFNQEHVNKRVMKKISNVWDVEFDRQLTRLMK